MNPSPVLPCLRSLGHTLRSSYLVPVSESVREVSGGTVDRVSSSDTQRGVSWGPRIPGERSRMGTEWRKPLPLDS